MVQQCPSRAKIHRQVSPSSAPGRDSSVDVADFVEDSFNVARTECCIWSAHVVQRSTNCNESVTSLPYWMARFGICHMRTADRYSKINTKRRARPHSKLQSTQPQQPHDSKMRRKKNKSSARWSAERPVISSCTERGPHL